MGSISIRLVVRRDSVKVWCGVRVNSVLCDLGDVVVPSMGGDFVVW